MAKYKHRRPKIMAKNVVAQIVQTIIKYKVKIPFTQEELDYIKIL